MVRSLYWIDAPPPGRLAIMARPRAGDWLRDEIAGWKRERVDIVVSLLEWHEVVDLELKAESAICKEFGVSLLSFPIPDRGTPTGDTRALARTLDEAMIAGKSIAIHYRAGIGRSALIAACVMSRRMRDVPAIFALIAAARGQPVPDTDEQRAWVTVFAGGSSR